MSYLDKAKEIVSGDRQKDYGSPIENFSRIAAMWSIILDKEVSVEEVTMCMIALKQCRLVNSPKHEDSWVDIAGFVGCMSMIHKATGPKPVATTETPKWMRQVKKW